MDEGTVRQAAQMWALVAEMHAITSDLAGMEYDNQEAHATGNCHPWPGSCFGKPSDELRDIAKRLREEI